MCTYVGYIRSSTSFLHAAEKLATTASANFSNAVSPENLEKIFSLAQALGIAQHHDAVAGTEKQHVADGTCVLLPYQLPE